jgi:hypothetical protein
MPFSVRCTTYTLTRRRLPYLAEVVTKLPETGYENALEFAGGLDLILDGLERLRHTGAAPG